MDPQLNGQHIALFVEDGFEPTLLDRANDALQAEGAITKIVSPRRRPVPALDAPPDASPGDGAVGPDLSGSEADARIFDAVILIGSAHGGDPDQHGLSDFLVDMQAAGKPIGAIAHGANLLLSSGLVAGRTLTSVAPLADAVRAGGGQWIDQPVVVDRNLITGRGVEDIDVFNRELVAVVQARLGALLKGTVEGAHHAMKHVLR